MAGYVKKTICAAALIFLLGVTGSSYAQTHTITHHVTWHTENQNMWGPNGQPFTIDTNITLFWFDFGDTISINFIQNIFGGQFGAALDIGTWLEIGSVFSINGFTTGSIDATYPVSIDLTFPNNYTFNPGSNVTINSDYSVLPGWDLTSHFPTAGVIQLDLFFGFGFNIDATVCIWNCWTVSPINIQVPTDSINIFYLNSQTGQVAYPCWNGWFFSICHDTILPIVIPDFWGIGLTATIDIPYIQTTDWLGADNCLYAHGSDPWINVNLNVIQFLSAIAGLIPPPTGPAIQQLLGMLSGTINVGGGITIDYILLALNFGFDSYMVQDLTLCPTIWTTFDFPTSVSYMETDPSSGNALVAQGNSSVITIHTGNDLHFDYPCWGYPAWDMGIAHHMTNDFTNHLWDSMAFYFSVTAFEFWINIPSFPVLPDICIPEFCIMVQIPCPEKAPIDTCWQEVCSPEICTPPVTLNLADPVIHIGPLYHQVFPLGFIPITWFNQTWQLAGWTPNQTGIFDTIMPPHTIIPNPEMELTLAISTPLICYGHYTGELTALVTNGTAPYTYVWSTGDTVVTQASANTLSNVGAGLYWVTVSDVNGCTLWDSITIQSVDPQLFIWLEPTMVTCVGGSDGQIIAHVSGGTPPYNYTWHPFGGNNPLASGLPAGTYWVDVVDIHGCHIYDTTTLTELYPLPPINFTAQPTQGCQPLPVQFYELSPSQGQTYLWDFHDMGATSTEKDPFHIFFGAGYFDITLYVTSIHGCLDSLTIDSMIWVHPKPIADFIAMPDVIDRLDPGIYFENTSSDTYYCFWTFGDGGASQATHPFHSYMDTGVYTVTLYIGTQYGCRDTVSKIVRVKEAYTFYAPNAFTPDNNGINEHFVVKGIGIDNSTFQMTIYSRWGDKVFETDDIHTGWNGKDKNGNVMDVAVYTWIVTYRDIASRKKHKHLGTVLLLR
jgi:gliding motility-associated-like protein